MLRPSRFRRPLATLAAVLLASAALIPRLTATPATTSAPAPLLAPTHQIPLSSSDPLYAAAVLPDGSAVLLAQGRSVANLWTALVFFWPELFALAALPVLIIALVRLWRTIRDPHRPGEWYCRRCGYSLELVRHNQCPECGAPPSRRNWAVGRPKLPRILLHAALLVVLPLAYGALSAIPDWRQGSIGNWFAWHSSTLARIVAPTFAGPYLLQTELTVRRQSLAPGGGDVIFGSLILPPGTVPNLHLSDDASVAVLQAGYVLVTFDPRAGWETARMSGPVWEFLALAPSGRMLYLASEYELTIRDLVTGRDANLSQWRVIPPSASAPAPQPPTTALVAVSDRRFLRYCVGVAELAQLDPSGKWSACEIERAASPHGLIVQVTATTVLNSRYVVAAVTGAAARGWELWDLDQARLFGSAADPAALPIPPALADLRCAATAVHLRDDAGQKAVMVHSFRTGRRSPALDCSAWGRYSVHLPLHAPQAVAIGREIAGPRTGHLTAAVFTLPAALSEPPGEDRGETQAVH